jgi:hypothetical protein
MEQFLTEGPIEALFGLMLLPLAGGAVLLVFLVVSAVRRGKKSKMKLGTQPDALAPAKKPAPPAELTAEELNLRLLSQQAPPPVSSAPVKARAMELATEEAAEVMRLRREPQTGQLIVEVAGQRYLKLAEVRDKNLGQDILKITAHLLAFTNGMIMTDAGMKSVAAPNKELPPLPRPRSGPAAPATPVPPPLSSPKAVEPLPLQKMASAGLLPKTNAIPKSKPAAPAPTSFKLNLAEEIDEIVQRRLADSPLAATTQIAITGDSSGGLVIRVNNQTYPTADDIQDSAARNLIKDSIKEWERR